MRCSRELRRQGESTLSVRRCLLAAALAGAVSFTGLGLSASATESIQDPTTSRPDAAVTDAQARGLIVKTTTATPSDSLLAATDDAIGTEAEVVDDDVLSGRISSVGFDEVVDVDVASDAAVEIEQRSDVVWAVPDTLLQTTSAPPVSVNDPRFPNQTNLWNTEGTAGGYSIKAPALWRRTMGSSDVTVAVLDTGVTEHPELAGQLTDDHDLDPGDWSAYGECGPRSPASDSSWHGTFVAGIIAAQAGNGRYTAGIAPGVKVRPIRVIETCGGTTEDILAGMKRATTGPEAARVVNMSLTMQAADAADRDAYCELYDRAATTGDARKALFVVAAGNDYGNANLAIPAACSSVVSVGATTDKGFSSSFSNVGSTVDLSAPGGDSAVGGKSDLIWSLDNTGKQGPGAPTEGRSQGTSFATPAVSSTAALLFSLGLQTPAEVRAALYASVSPFRARNSTYATKKVKVGSKSYVFDLNCAGHAWCGRGLLDLSRVEAQVTAPRITGAVAVGEPLTASTGTWVRQPAKLAYRWTSDGEQVGTSSTYRPTRADVGRAVEVTVSPASGPFMKLTPLRSAAVTVPDGPAVTISAPPSTTYGSSVALAVTSTTDGPVEIRTDFGTVIGTGAVVDGAATVTIAGTRLKPGDHVLRAAYVGEERASSPRTRVTVEKLPATVSGSMSSRVKRTSRSALKVSVDERPNLFAGPTGTLKVYDGSRRLTTVTLKASDRGRRTIRLPRLKKGSHRIKVVYGGNTYIGTTSSSTRTVRSS